MSRKISDEVCIAALEHLAEGGSISSAAEAAGISKSGLYRRLMMDHEQGYFMALQIRSADQVDEMRGYKRELIEGVIDPQMYNALLSHTKWQAGKEYSKLYGEKKQLDVNTRTLPDLLDEIDDVGDDAVSEIESDEQ